MPPYQVLAAEYEYHLCKRANGRQLTVTTHRIMAQNNGARSIIVLHLLEGNETMRDQLIGHRCYRTGIETSQERA